MLKPIGSFTRSLQMEDRPEQRTCPEHGEYTAEVTYIKGKKAGETPCPVCARIAAKIKAEREERERIEAIEREKLRTYEATLNVMAIPERYRSKTFETFKTDGNGTKERVLTIVKSYVTKFDELRVRGIGMTLIGECGTGKTHLACAVLQELMTKCAGVYTTANQMGQKVADSWGCKEPGHTTADVKRVFKTCPILVVDEVAKEDAKPVTKEVLSEVIYARYDALLPTIWITNAKANHLAEAIGNQEYDRLKETCKFINCSWASYRANDIEF